MNFFASPLIRLILFLSALWLLPGSAYSENTSPPVKEWVYATTGAIWSSPVLVQKTLFFGNDDGVVFALGSENGRVKWQYKTGGMVRCKPAIEKKTVYISSDDGYLYAIDIGTGSLRWRVNIENNVRKRLPANDEPYDFDYLQSSPNVTDGVLYIGSSNHHLYAINTSDGSIKWRFPTKGIIRATPLVHDAVVYVGSWDGYMYALKAGVGELIWSSRIGEVIQSTAAIYENKLIIGSRGASLSALNIANGSLEWTCSFPDGSWVESTPVILGNKAYIGSSDARLLLCIEADSGEIRWKSSTGGWAWGTPVIHEKIVYIGSISARYSWASTNVRALQAFNIEDGRRIYRFYMDKVEGFVTGGIFSSPIVTDSHIYIASVDSNFYSLKR